MLTAGRSLVLNHDAGKELPRIPELVDLYRLGGGSGVKFRQGMVAMIAGRSGTLKSFFAMWLTTRWAQLEGVSTLYFSADMSAFTASTRIAAMVMDETTEEVEQGMQDPRTRAKYRDALAPLPVQFSFGSPITWRGIEEEIEGYVELWNAYPQVVVFDNLMDFEGADSDYTAQMDAMSGITAFSRETGITSIVLHHATDKSMDAKTAPYDPPTRQDIKGGLSERPELSLSVALDPNDMTYRIACIKQRMGPCDPAARHYAVLLAEPERGKFHTTGRAY
jgi:hypothetical protein